MDRPRTSSLRPKCAQLLKIFYGFFCLPTIEEVIAFVGSERLPQSSVEKFWSDYGQMKRPSSTFFA